MGSKITKRVVEALEPGERDRLVWDSEIMGLGVRCSRGGVKSYVLQYRNRQRVLRRMTLGRYPILTPEIARQRAIKFLAEVADGGDPLEAKRAPHGSPTVAQVAERALAEHWRPKRRPRWTDSVEKLLKKWILPALGQKPIAELARADVLRLHHEHVATPSEANRAIAVVSKLVSLSELWGLRPEGANPCRGIERYRERRRERFLGSAELAQLGVVLAEAERTRPAAASAVTVVRLLALTGARRNEIAHLRWEYVDLERGLLNLPESKTGRKTIRLGAPAVQLLAGLPRTSEWVFPGPCSQGPVHLERAWRSLRKRAGLDDVRLHDLRHTHASVGAAAGLSLPLIGALLGHKTAAMTQRYAHLRSDVVHEASEIVAARIAADLAPSPAAPVIPLASGQRG